MPAQRQSGTIERILLLAGTYLIVLAPVAIVVGVALFLSFRLRARRGLPVGRKDRGMTAVLLAFPAAFFLIWLPAPWHAGARGLIMTPFRVTGLYDACGGPAGIQRFVRHWSDPDYGFCGLCDDWVGAGHAEYRQLFCPEHLGPPGTWEDWWD